MTDATPRTDVDYAKHLTQEQLEQGAHRRRAGGLWRKMGKLQLKFLTAHGLEPGHRLLDVGCGPLRAGVRLAEYLDAGNYYGIDINESLLDVGYDVELPDEVRAKLPRENLRATDRFDCDFGVTFDFAIGQSLFTHISLNQIRLCLFRVAAHTKVGGRFYATFFEAEAATALDDVLEAKQGIYAERNPYWYWPDDLEWAAGFSPWRFRYIGDWGHPRNQMIVEFKRRPDSRRALLPFTRRR
ncbi:MAG TPA: class I SAM-dependent methyltransferase [Gaiellaceae bacterium]|jgi:SAM-dependent methyltransferase